jgi:serine/threonine protein kinase
LATNYDVMFLRLLIEGGQLGREQGLACLQQIDAGSPPPSAAQVALQAGVIDEAAARRVHEQVMAHFARSGEQVAQISREEAVRGVSSEAQPLPERPPPQEPRYFDLTHSSEGLEGFRLGPQTGQSTCYSSYQGLSPEGEPVRILTLSSRFETLPELVAEVRAELESWLGFRHPSGSGPIRIGRTIGRPERPAQTVVVYPHPPGQPVAGFLSQHGPFESEEALEIVIDLCAVLSQAHPKGLAAGDIRSGSVAFDGQQATLLDLGLSRAHCVAGGWAAAGVPFGHPGYLAPEVIQERQAKPAAASDVYALGILFYELICGVPPYQGPARELLEQHFATPLPPPPPEVSFSTATAGVILRMTAKTLDERAQDSVSLVRALENFRAGRAFRIHVGPPAQVPLGAEPVSQDAWADTAAKAAEGGATDWTESMIDQAPGVGPSELQPLASGSIEFMHGMGEPVPAAVGPVSQRLPREMLARLRAEEAVSDLAASVPEPEPEKERKVQIGEKLGRGAIGASYDGLAPGHDGPVVLKAISRKFAKHVEILEQVRGEIRAATKVRGPQVVSVLDLIEADERDLIVSERSKGKTLDAVLREKPRQSLDQVVTLARDLSSALKSGLAAGISHGDIRPEKIYLERGRARLADFGHARGSCLGAGLGKYGLYFGHPHYLAPEVLQQSKERPSLASDLYAVGVVLYQALCGVLPFTGKGIRKTLLAQIKQPLPPPPSDLSVPSALAQLIIRLTTKDPSGRFGSLDELEAALDSCLEASMASADALRPGGSGLASALQVEEFDPLASSMGDEAREAWGERSQDTAKPPREWSRAKIAAAGNSGPDWGGAKATAGELYADLEKGALAEAVATAATSAKPARGKAKKKKGKGKEEGGNAPFLVGGALVLLIAAGIAAAVMKGGGDDPPTKRTPRPVVPSTPGGGPVKTPVVAGVDDSKREAALSGYKSEVRSLVSSGRFAAAAEFPLPELLRKDAAALTLRSKLIKEAREAAQKKLKGLEPRFRGFLDSNRLSEAADLVKEIEEWAPKTLSEAWSEDLRKRLEAEEGQFSTLRGRLKLKGGEMDPKRILSRVRHKRARAYTSGGLVAQYTRGRELPPDLQLLRVKGDPSLGDAPSGARGVALSGTRRKPGVLVWKPQLLVCQRIRVRLELRAATGALLVGVDGKGQDGVGVSFGGGKAELGRRRLDRGAEGEPLDGPLEIEIKLGGSGRPRLECRAGDAKRAVEIAPDRLGGYVGLCVDGGEAWIVKLEVAGIAK